MLVFLDTEFTNFGTHDLISLALVGEDGQEFYAERTDFPLADCSEFVRHEVLPLLGRVPDAECTQNEMTERLRRWMAALSEQALFVFDFKGDWQLLTGAWLGTSYQQAPPNVGDKLHLANHTLNHPVFKNALNAAYSQDWPEHHALADARALMAGYRAWKTFMEPIQRIR